MKLEHWEPDIDALLRRMAEGEVDLQPNFQRGLVWNRSKQQRLIDTVLRGWSIPPIHLVVTDDEKMLVLDGQQRLAAIQDFAAGTFPVGSFSPEDPAVELLSGRYLKELPNDVRRRFKNFRISCYRLTEYEADEPYELFFRLNMPTGLTQAEKRNSLIGEPRMQVRELVESADWSSERVGFANGRMSYDDILARCCCYVEARTLRASINTNSLEARYRQKSGFSGEVMRVVERSVGRIGDTIESASSPIRFNKATLLSWMMVFARQELDADFRSIAMESWVPRIEAARAVMRSSRDVPEAAGFREISDLLDVYTDRASLRVGDVLSVVLRDFSIWAIVGRMSGSSLFATVDSDLERVSRSQVSYAELVDLVQNERYGWGDLS